MLVETRPVTPETVTPISPSEAYRLGRLSHPRSNLGSMVNGDESACVMGAIGLGAGLDASVLRRMLVINGLLPTPIYEWMQVKAKYPCNCNERLETQRGGIITHLNDGHVFNLGDWTEQDIVDWMVSEEG